MSKYIPTTEAFFSQLTTNGERCGGSPTSSWSNLGTGTSEQQCKQKCEEMVSCRFVVHRSGSGGCTQFSTCNTFESNADAPCTAWQKA